MSTPPPSPPPPSSSLSNSTTTSQKNTTTTKSTTNNNTKPKRIIVPQRVIQGGFDSKFETNPNKVKNLHGLLTPEEYKNAILSLNERLKPSRSGVIDKGLLVTGPLIVPLAIWGIRHSNQTKRRKRLLRQGIAEFNEQYPQLLMKWNQQYAESILTIELRVTMQQQQQQQDAVQPSVQEQTPMISYSSLTPVPPPPPLPTAEARPIINSKEETMGEMHTLV